MAPRERVVVREVNSPTLTEASGDIAPAVVFTSRSTKLDKGLGDRTKSSYRTIGGFALHAEPFYWHVKDRQGLAGGLATRMALSTKVHTARLAVSVKDWWILQKRSKN